MSIRLVRQSSDTPNITNRDDTRMTRFAYGGIDGVVQGFGSELSYTVSGSNFVLNSGCIVLQGWEVDVDGSGWQLDLSTVVGTQYHLVYLEVNVAAETAAIKSTYLPSVTPIIDSGDDLTRYPEGTARLPLYSFIVANGTIHSVIKKFSMLSYYGARLDSIEERLGKLGFREGSVGSIPFSTSEITNNFIKRQGNYVFGGYSATFPTESSFEELAYVTSLGVIPKEFLPAYDVVSVSASMFATVYVAIYNPSGTAYQAQVIGYYAATAIISKDTGNISWYNPPEVGVVADVSLSKIQTLSIQFAYEAKPL